MINKKIWLTFVTFVLGFQLFAGDFLNTYYRSPSLSYNESKYTTLRIENTFSENIEDITLEVIDSNGFEVTILENKGLSLLPKEKTEVVIKVKCKERTLFKKHKTILVEIKSNGRTIQKELKIAIVPPRYIWPIVGIAFSVIFSVLLIIVFRRISKGENYDR